MWKTPFGLAVTLMDSFKPKNVQDVMQDIRWNDLSSRSGCHVQSDLCVNYFSPYMLSYMQIIRHNKGQRAK